MIPPARVCASDERHGRLRPRTVAQPKTWTPRWTPCTRPDAPKPSPTLTAEPRPHAPDGKRCAPTSALGDVLVITELSRMTRSLMHLLHIVQELEARQVALQSLREHIDTSTATGRGFLAIMGVIAQMEREIKAERAAAGRAAAKARGKTGGRPLHRSRQARTGPHPVSALRQVRRPGLSALRL